MNRRRRKARRQVSKRFRSAPRPDQLKVPEDEKRQRARLFRVNFVYATISLASVGLILRLGYLQITKSPHFRSAAVTTSLNTVSVLPARGRLYDVNGNLLAYDQPVYDVYYTQISNINTTPVGISHLAQQLAPEFKTKAKAIRQAINHNNNVDQYATFKLFSNINQRQLAYIGEHSDSLPGISVQTDGQRSYPYGDLGGHLLGYVGPIQQNLQSYLNKGYQRNQIVGLAGLEATYETYLQGKVGNQIEEVNTNGNLVNQATYSPKPEAGKNLQLTMDGHLQADTQEALETTIDSYQSKNNVRITDASAVMIDVKTGGVLAMASYPYMDPNWFITPQSYTKHAAYLSTQGVEVNNAIQSPLYPGSTMKPANMLTGLEKGVITPTYRYYDFSAPLRIGTQPFKEDASYGWVDDVKAIAVSDDQFFYTLGLNLGKWIGSTAYSGGGPLGGNLQYWRDHYFIRAIMDLVRGEMRFGIGQLTHIDLPNEYAGSFYIENNQGLQVPLDVKAAQKSLKETGSYSNEGSPSDLANMAFGQSQEVTPIELAQYVTTIADNGKRLQPHFLNRVLPPGMYRSLSGVKVKPVYTFGKHVQANLNLNSQYLNIVQQGMYQVCNMPYGTAYNSFFNAPYKAAGKTGTAEIYMNGQKINNSVFIGYAPFNNPQVAVAVMVPGAGYGATTAVPIARNMMDDYFDEHHASFMPKNQWTSTAIPSNWTKSTAYTTPESAK